VNFMALLHANRNEPWNTFDPRRKPSAQTARYHSFLQFEFFRQWTQLRKYCRERNVSLLGDLPFYVEYNSADVWSHPALFDLDQNHHMRSVGGVPPDYFSADGQRWGSPTYRWDRIAQNNFRWWVDRFRFAFEHLDLLRVDHFRGFEAFWSVPAQDETARNGHWVAGPGAALFEAVKQQLGDAPIIAENLGVISPEVEALRNQLASRALPSCNSDSAKTERICPRTTRKIPSLSPALTITTRRTAGGANYERTRSVATQPAIAKRSLASNRSCEPMPRKFIGLASNPSWNRVPIWPSFRCRMYSASAARRA